MKMRLKRLILNNFKCLEQFELVFSNSKKSILIGNNGSGKTTILDAIALCFTHFTGELLSSKEGYNIDGFFKNDDITIGKDKGKIQVIFETSIPNQEGEKSITVTKVKDKLGLSFQKDPLDLIKDIKAGIRESKIKSIPIVAYFNVNRTCPGKQEEDKPILTYNDKLFAYERALKLHTPNFTFFEEWFKNQITVENAQKVQNNDLNFQLPALKNIRTAFETFLNCIEPDTYGDVTVIHNTETLADFSQKTTPQLAIKKDGVYFHFNQFSSGERMIFGLLLEIARRLTIANENSEDALAGDGIVLIDELDLHLHPKWQKSIFKALNSTFPNIQFICTTHSPLILSGFNREDIINIENGVLVPSAEIANVYSATADEILEKILHTEPSIDDYDDRKMELERLLNEFKFDEAEVLLNELKAEINSTPQWLEDYEIRLEYERQ